MAVQKMTGKESDMLNKRKISKKKRLKNKVGRKRNVSDILVLANFSLP